MLCVRVSGAIVPCVSEYMVVLQWDVCMLLWWYSNDACVCAVEQQCHVCVCGPAPVIL